MPDSDPQTMPALLSDALRESSDLARKEMALFKTEMTDNIRSLVSGLVMIIAAAVFAVAALIFLLQALVEWLATVVHSEALAALIVGVVMAAITVGLGLYGRSTMASASLAPTRTAQSVRRDAEVISERVSK
ncbi:MAG TPA: phage holin family protein [Herpetosiphonaceae bacterium]|nr:phage holin family protein [Herpetosiphonaceae bacterium]